MGSNIGSDCEEKSIPGQEGSDHQSRLAENDSEQDGIDPEAVEGDDVLKAFVKVEEVCLKPVNEIHRAYEAGLPLHGNTRDGRASRRTP